MATQMYGKIDVDCINPSCKNNLNNSLTTKKAFNEF